MVLDTKHRCLNCGFEDASGAEAWRSVDHPPLGEMTQCPDCGSTNITTL